MWRIRSRTLKDRNGRPLYWAYDVGWTWKEFADVFTDAEQTQMILPTRDGEWEAITRE